MRGIGQTAVKGMRGDFFKTHRMQVWDFQTVRKSSEFLKSEATSPRQQFLPPSLYHVRMARKHQAVQIPAAELLSPISLLLIKYAACGILLQQNGQSSHLSL